MNKEVKFIAIVDDSDFFRNSVKKILSDFDCYFLEACDGEEGFKVIKKNHNSIGLLIIDLNMPKLNGIQVLEKMFSESIGKEIPVILFTSEPPKEFDKLRKRITNLRAWMLKPIMEKKFTIVARKLLKNL
mgnify:FL=1